MRQGELAAKRDAVADILRRLGREGEADPRKLMLPVRVVGALEDLIAARSGVLSKLEAAGEAAEAARSAHALALQEAPQRVDDQAAAMASLKARLAEARRHDSPARLLRRARRRRQDDTKAQGGLRGLAPWRGNAEALAQAAVPEEAETAELRRRVAQIEGAQTAELRSSRRQDRRSRSPQGRGGGRGARGRSLQRRGGGRDSRRARRRVVGASRGARSRERRYVRSGDAARRRGRRDETGRRAGTRRLARARDQARRRRSGTGARQRPTSKRRTRRSPRSIMRSRRLRPPRRRTDATRSPSSTPGG